MALISKVKIGNMALSKLGITNQIEDFGEDTAEADQVELWYDYSRLQTLEGYNWSFARKRRTLATASEDPPDDWAYRYAYPSDCVKLRLIWNPTGRTNDLVPFDTELNTAGVKTILTDMEEAQAIYTKDVENVALFSPHFVEVLNTALAYHMAFALTGKYKVQEGLYNDFNRLINLAPALDSYERVEDPVDDCDWVKAR